jgi:glycerol-3-phosphate acyltransferase PlsX
MFGGAPLLGLGGNVLKAHGSSNRDAVSHAIRIAGVTIEKNITEHAQRLVAQANERIKEPPQGND